MHGVYTAPERVERGGRLVCFAGERMTMAEAARRGLADGPGTDAARPLSKMLKDELADRARELGVELSGDETKRQLAALVAAAGAQETAADAQEA